MSFLFLLPLHLPAFNSLSYFWANLFSCDSRYTELCPCDVTFHQPHLQLLLQNMVFGPTWTGRLWSLVQQWTADSHQPTEMASVHGESFALWMGFMNTLHRNCTRSPHGEQFISVMLEECWGNRELPPASALVLIPIHWKCLKNVQGKTYWHR